MSIDSSPTSVEGLLAAAQGKDSGELKALVARIVIDSLGRPWDPLKHPRDAEGKFIETFAEVRGLFRTRGGAKGAPQVSGRVVAFDRNGDVFVRIDNVAEGYTAHKPGDLVAIKTDDLQALDAKAKINRPIDENQRAQLKAVADRVRAVDADAADALERAADPANTEAVAQLADLREARDLLDDNEDETASPAARDIVWDLLDQVGDQPTNDEVLRAAKHLIRDDMVKRGVDQQQIARLDADIEAPAPSAREGAPDPVDVFAAQLYRRADVLKDRVPADANALKAVADALGDAAQSGMSPEDRAAKLRAAQVRALPIKDGKLKKQVNDRIKALLANPKAPAAPVPERKAEVAPPPPAQPLTPEAPGRSVDAVPAAPQVEGDAPAPDQAEEIGKVPGNLTGRTSPGVAKAIADALPDAPDDWPRDAKSLWKETQDEFRAISEMPDGPEADDAFLSAVTDAEELLRGSRVEADPAQAQNPDDSAGWADLVDKLDAALAEHREVWDGLISRPRPVPAREPAQPVAQVPEPQAPEIPDGWVPVEKDPGFLNQRDAWTKDGYEVWDEGDRLVVGQYNRNGAALWRADAKDWAEVEAIVNDRESGGIPQADRVAAVESLKKMGFGDDALGVVQYGSYAEIEDALRADPRWAEMEAGYRDAMDADGWRAKDKKAFQEWNDLQSGVLLKLKAARNIAPAAGGDGPSEPPAAPEVPAYSGELRPVQPRDVEEMLRAVDNAKNWLSESNVDFMYDDQVGGVQDARDKQRLADDWARVEDGLRRKDYGAAQAALGDIEDALGNPNVDPEFLDNQKPFVEQVRGVLDKVVQRDRGQFEIPGAAPASPAARIEDAAPELNAAFDAERRDNPEINTNMSQLVDALIKMRNDFRDYNEADFEIDGAQRAIDAFNRLDYFAGLDLADAAVRGKAAGDYVAGFDAKNALERVKIDWQNMLDGNPDLARYLPGARSEAPAPVDFPSDEPLAEWEKVLLDGIAADERDAAKAVLDKASAPEGEDVLDDPQNRYQAWQNVVADMDNELGMGELYNEYVQDGRGDADDIKAAVGRIRAQFDRDGDKIAVGVLDDILARNGVTQDAGVPEPSPELMIPDAPGDGSPVKDERRILQPRVRGEIEAVARGVGLPELPDRIDLDRNGVVVAPLDLVEVPAAGNQGPQNALRRPAGIGQIRRIYTKGGVRYAEVAFYDPAFVDYPHKNAAKARGGIKNNEPFYRWDGIRLDKVQKVDDSNPDAQEFLSHLGPEEQRQYAGRNAGRLAQQRGRVRAEMERMANLRYIADRYVPDADGLLVGKGDVVVYKGKKYEVARVDNDDPGVGNNKRLDLIPLGIDGAPELQAGGKHANPYARMVRFYDQPLGDAQPAVTIDELKDMVKRLDGGGRYQVGDAVRAALEGDDLKEVARAFNEDPAIQKYIADGRAYIQDYVNRLLQANVRGNYDEVKRNEPEMVRKDKNDLLNAMAAVEGRFLVGDGRDRHIRREIPEAGPDAGYQGNRPEVLLPLRYKDALGVIDRKIEVDPGNPMWGAAKEMLQEQGVKNLDDDGQFEAARDVLRVIRSAAQNGGGEDIADALGALIDQMNAWHDEQLKRRAIVQGGPGGLNPLPVGRTVAPGLVRDPRLSEPQAQGAPEDADGAFADKLLRNAAGENDRVKALQDEVDAVRRAALNDDWADEFYDYLVDVFARLRRGDYGVALRKLDDLIFVDEDGPNYENLKNWQDEIAKNGWDVELRDKLLPVLKDYGPLPASQPARALPARRVERVNPPAPAAPAAPEPPQSPVVIDGPMPQAMVDHLTARARAGFIRPAAQEAARALGRGEPVEPDALQMLRDDVDKRLRIKGQNGPGAKPYQDAKDWLDAYAARAQGPYRVDLAAGQAKIDDLIEAKYKELRADRKNNAARRAANDLDELGDDLRKALEGADKPEDRESGLAAARQAVTDIEEIDSTLAEKLRREIDGIAADFDHKQNMELVDRYLGEAEGLHNQENPDPDNRERMLRAAEDIAQMMQSSDPVSAQQILDRIAAARAKYEADDIERQKVKPVRRTEAVANIDGMVAAERERLRAEGKAKDARELVNQADDVADALNDAEDANRAGDIDARNEAMQRAAEAIPPLQDLNPEIAKAAQDMVDGVNARYARDDQRKANGGGADVQPGGMDDQEDWDLVNQAAQDFAGLTLKQMKSQGKVGDWEKERTLSNGINGVYLWRNAVTGQRVVIKKDNDYGANTGNGAAAEEMVARLYRDMGFAQPAAVLINPDAPTGSGDDDRRALVAMSYADDGFYGLTNINMTGRQSNIRDIDPEFQEETFLFVMANGIIGNTDRHGHNLMWGDTPNGKKRLVVIDNGLALMNGHFGEAGNAFDQGNPLRMTPDKVIAGRYGNANTVKAIAAQYYAQNPAKARTALEEFAKRMQERAKLLAFVDDRVYDYIDARTQWVLDHLDDYLRSL